MINLDKRTKKICIALAVLGLSVPAANVMQCLKNKESRANTTSIEQTIEDEQNISDMVEEVSKKYNVNKNVVLSLIIHENGTDMNSKVYSEDNNPGHILPWMIDYQNNEDVELVKVDDDNYKLKFTSKEKGLEYFVKMLKEEYKCDETSDKEFIDNYYQYNLKQNGITSQDKVYDSIFDIYKNIEEDYHYYESNNDNIKKLIMNC